jgi:anaerobic magnesium-protoporphyrin IX monomethyl ester cyclase
MKSARIVLVKPPEKCKFNFGTFSLGVLASAVRHLACISIFDATTMPIPKAVKTIRSLRPDIIGVTVMGSASVKPVVDFVQQLKNDAGNTLIIAGGHGASCEPLPILNAGADVVVVGEGERTLCRITEEGFQPRMPGTACLLDDKIVTGPPQDLVQPLDSLTLPARDLMLPPSDGIYLMETSRGCPHACAFCETTRFYGRRWRPHSPERVADEVKHLMREYDAWILHFADDNFAADTQRVLEICERMRRSPLPAMVLASARADDLVAEPRLLQEMAAAHILRLSVGVETVDRETAIIAGKTIPPGTYREAFRSMRENGIFSVASFIIGLPGESRAARERSVELAVWLEPDSAHFLPFLPLSGIPLAPKQGGLPDQDDIRDASRFTEAFFRHPTVLKRLSSAVSTGGIRGILAQATLNRTSPN